MKGIILALEIFRQINKKLGFFFPMLHLLFLLLATAHFGAASRVEAVRDLTLGNGILPAERVMIS